jgi:hypothetical protein
VNCREPLSTSDFTRAAVDLCLRFIVGGTAKREAFGIQIAPGLLPTRQLMLKQWPFMDPETDKSAPIGMPASLHAKIDICQSDRQDQSSQTPLSPFNF